MQLLSQDLSCQEESEHEIGELKENENENKSQNTEEKVVMESNDQTPNEHDQRENEKEKNENKQEKEKETEKEQEKEQEKVGEREGEEENEKEQEKERDKEKEEDSANENANESDKDKNTKEDVVMEPNEQRPNEHDQRENEKEKEKDNSNESPNENESEKDKNTKEDVVMEHNEQTPNEHKQKENEKETKGEEEDVVMASDGKQNEKDMKGEEGDTVMQPNEKKEVEMETPEPVLPNHTPEERSMLLSKTLSHHWGFQKFRGNQEDVVVSAIEGRDSFVCMATGAGKSLCYQVPPLYTQRTTIVISPLISLMADQVFSLMSRGIPAASFAPDCDYHSIEEKFLSGQLRLLYLTPERLSYSLELLKTAVKKKIIGLFAVDEAHCISEWGHEFRKEFRQVSAIREHFPQIPIMALTATATKAVQKDVMIVLRLNQPLVVRSTFNRPNLHFSVRLKTADLRQDLLSAFDEISKFSNTEKPPVLIYCPIINDTEKIRSCLAKEGIKSATYHGRVPLDKRDVVHQDFLNERIQVIVATSAFGMGVDKPNTRGVINYGITKSIETYYQQAGRAGRDGAPAKSIMFYKPGDFNAWGAMSQRELAENSLEQEAEARRLQRMQFFAATTSCRRKIVVEYFDDELDSSVSPEFCCDNCEKKDRVVKNLVDDSVLMLKAVRLRNRFGRTVPIDILCGKASKTVKQQRLDQEDLFQKGVHHTREWWKALVTVLMEKKLLMETIVNSCKLCKISESGRELIAVYDRAKAAISLTKPNPPAVPTLEIVYTDEMLAAEMPGRLRETGCQFNTEGEKKLLAELRGLRSQLTNSSGNPSFNNATIEELVRVRPTGARNFLAIKGIGRIKLGKYGERFMSVIKSVCEKYGLQTDVLGASSSSSSSSSSPLVPSSPSVPKEQRTLIDLWNQGKTVDEICAIQREPLTSIYTDLAQLVLVHGCNIDIASPQLQLDPLRLEEVKKVLDNWASRFGGSSLPRPHELHEQLHRSEDYSFGLLKFILTLEKKKRDLAKKPNPPFDPLTSSRKSPPKPHPYVSPMLEEDIEDSDFWEELVRTCPVLDNPPAAPKVQSQSLASQQLPSVPSDPKRKRIEAQHDPVAKRARSTQPPAPSPLPNFALSQPQPNFSRAAMSLATASFRSPPTSPEVQSRDPSQRSSPELRVSPLSPSLSPKICSPEKTASASQSTPQSASPKQSFPMSQHQLSSSSASPPNPKSPVHFNPSQPTKPMCSPQKPSPQKFLSPTPLPPSQTPPTSSPQKPISPSLTPPTSSPKKPVSPSHHQPSPTPPTPSPPKHVSPSHLQPPLTHPTSSPPKPMSPSHHQPSHPTSSPKKHVSPSLTSLTSSPPKPMSPSYHQPSLTPPTSSPPKPMSPSHHQPSLTPPTPSPQKHVSPSHHQPSLTPPASSPPKPLSPSYHQPSHPTSSPKKHVSPSLTPQTSSPPKPMSPSYHQPSLTPPTSSPPKPMSPSHHQPSLTPPTSSPKKHVSPSLTPLTSSPPKPTSPSYHQPSHPTSSPKKHVSPPLTPPTSSPPKPISPSLTPPTSSPKKPVSPSHHQPSHPTSSPKKHVSPPLTPPTSSPQKPISPSLTPPTSSPQKPVSPSRHQPSHAHPTSSPQKPIFPSHHQLPHAHPTSSPKKLISPSYHQPSRAHPTSSPQKPISPSHHQLPHAPPTSSPKKPISPSHHQPSRTHPTSPPQKPVSPSHQLPHVDPTSSLQIPLPSRSPTMASFCPPLSAPKPVSACHTSSPFASSKPTPSPPTSPTKGAPPSHPTSHPPRTFSSPQKSSFFPPTKTLPSTSSPTSSPTPTPTPTFSRTTNPTRSLPSSPVSAPPRPKSVSPCTNRSPIPPFPKTSATPPRPSLPGTKQPVKNPSPQIFYPSPTEYVPSEKTKARALFFQSVQESIPMTDHLADRRHLSRHSLTKSELGTRKTIGTRAVPIRRTENLVKPAPVAGQRRGVGPILTSTPTKDACLMYASPAELSHANLAPQPVMPLNLQDSPNPASTVTLYAPAHHANATHKRQTSVSKPVPSVEECRIQNVSEYILGAASQGITENDVLLHFKGRVSPQVVSSAFDQLQLQFSVYKNGEQFFSL